MQQQQVYDRRTSGEKLQGAITMTAKRTLEHLDEWHEDEQGEEKEEEEATPTFKTNDIVALVTPHSTATLPDVLIAKILRMDFKKKEVLLAHLKRDFKKENTYILTVGEDTWKEDFASLIYPVDITYSQATKTYTLRSSLRDIHNSVQL